MRYRIYPSNMASESAKKLAEELKGLRVKEDGKYVPRKNDVLINWGNPRNPCFDAAPMLNKPYNVGVAGDKLESFKMFDHDGVPTVDWTGNREVAVEWLREGFVVIARTLKRASGGKGIVVVTQPDDGDKMEDMIMKLPSCKLYTKYTPHSGEYRVHVVKGKIIDFVRKKKMSPEKLEEQGLEFNKLIRNHDNGWVFGRDGVEISDKIAEVAVKAVKALGLDFGAVDIINSKRRGVFCLEVNTAPGMEGTTLGRYVEAFKNC